MSYFVNPLHTPVTSIFSFADHLPLSKFGCCALLLPPTPVHLKRLTNLEITSHIFINSIVSYLMNILAILVSIAFIHNVTKLYQFAQIPHISSVLIFLFHGCTVVERFTFNLKTEGLNPTTGTWRDRNSKKYGILWLFTNFNKNYCFYEIELCALHTYAGKYLS